MSKTPSLHVVDASNENFQAEVIDRSRNVPVVVDFWAEWCGPCRTLGPVLERLAEEFGGKFQLVKADTEAVPEIAAAFGVRSIPAVFAVRDAQVVDGFVGALPEEQIREFLARIMPSPAEILASEAKALEETDPKTAEAKYRKALGLDPENPGFQLGLARSLVRQNRFDDALALIHSLEGHGYFDPEVEAVKAEIELKVQARESGGIESARKALAAQPDDPTLKLKLAEALAAVGDHEEALEICLGLVEEHRKESSDAARLVMLNIFQLLPPDAELANEYRRKLAAAIFI